MKTTRLNDIAEAAGVSIATASYALNGKPGVSAATREKVLAVAAYLNYTPAPSTWMINRSHGTLVYVLVDDYRAGVPLTLLQSLSQRFAIAGYQLLTTNQAILTSSRTNRFAGAITLSSRITSEQTKAIKKIGLPTLYLSGQSGPKTTCVTLDHEGSIGLALSTLAASPHQRLAVLGGKSNSPFNQERQDALQNQIGHFFPAFDLAHDYFTGDYTATAGEAMAKAAIPGHDAFLCFNDTIAIGLLKEAAETGLRVGRDISVLGFDNNEFGQYSAPALSTITFNETLWAQTILETFQQLVTGKLKKGLHRQMPAFLIERASIAKVE